MKCLFCSDQETQNYYNVKSSSALICPKCFTRYFFKEHNYVGLRNYNFTTYSEEKDIIYTANFIYDSKDVRFVIWSNKEWGNIIELTTTPNITPFNFNNKLKTLLPFI